MPAVNTYIQNCICIMFNDLRKKHAETLKAMKIPFNPECLL